MPELPEVETYVRELAPLLQGKAVVSGQVLWPKTIAAPDPKTFLDLIPGRRFVSFGRRGKYMLLGLDSDETLIVHLRMTGELRVQPASTQPDKHTHVLLALDSGEVLHYRDVRKFGRIWLTADPEAVLAKLGPEPLGPGFTPAGLAERLAGRSASVKSLLLQQDVVAGVGNIYADEALFLARLDPRRSGGDLSGEEVRRLHQGVQTVLQAGIAARGSSLRDYAPPTGEKGGFQERFQVFRRTGEPCPVCGTPIARTVLAQRSTHFCPQCQR